MTTTLHWSVLTGATEGQFTVQVLVAPTTVVEADAELSAWRSSVVVLETLAELVMDVPFETPLFTLKTSVNTAVALAGKVAIVQVKVPLPLPGVKVVQVKFGPDSCVSDTKVVSPGTEVITTTFSASSGPPLATSTL